MVEQLVLQEGRESMAWTGPASLHLLSFTTVCFVIINIDAALERKKVLQIKEIAVKGLLLYGQTLNSSFQGVK